MPTVIKLEFSKNGFAYFSKYTLIDEINNHAKLDVSKLLTVQADLFTNELKPILSTQIKEITTKECDECNGDGEVTVETEDWIDSNHYEVECDKCDGSGILDLRIPIMIEETLPIQLNFNNQHYTLGANYAAELCALNGNYCQIEADRIYIKL